MDHITVNFVNKTIAFNVYKPVSFSGLGVDRERLCILLRIPPPLPNAIRMDFEHRAVFYGNQIALRPELPVIREQILNILSNTSEDKDSADDFWLTVFGDGVFCKNPDPHVFTRKAFTGDELKRLLEIWATDED